MTPGRRRRYHLEADCCETDVRPLASLGAVPGVIDVQVLESANLVVITQAGGLDDQQVVRAAAGLGVRLRPESSPHAWWRRGPVVAQGLAAVLLLAGYASRITGAPGALAIAMFVATLAVGGLYPFRHAVDLLLERRLTVGTLVLFTCAGALALGRVTEAAELVVVFSLGETMEGIVADRARGSIRALMELRPREAMRRGAGGRHERVAVEALAPGDVITVRPGERFPTDGRVAEGRSWADQAAVTGESMPVDLGPGATVFGGTLNGDGALEVVVASAFADTVLARVIRQVEEAQANRGRAQRLADRFGAVFTPAMLVLAALVAVTGPLVGLGLRQAVYRGLVLLTVSCSCALVISVPVAVIAAIARGARDGILIKGGAYVEALSRLRAVAFDKTGTLTAGRPALMAVTPVAGTSQREVLALAASIEGGSEHPIARAVVRAASAQGITPRPASDFRAQPGNGAQAVVEGRLLGIGRPHASQREDPVLGPLIGEYEDRGFTAVILSEGDRPWGVLAVADAVRPEAAETIAQLRSLGLSRLVVLTGDNATVARRLAADLGLDEVHAELLPEDKSGAVRALRREVGALAMVGDGINDAPAMANADVAVAMGTAGTDVALETADLALMADDLTRLPAAIRLARRADAIIRQNIGLSLLSIAALVAAALAGRVSLAGGIVLSEGMAVLIIANGLRLLRPQRKCAR